jgi:NAD(P)-dependent dehydrogenase (short-subunit alcohol dehydrogenase family)
VIEARPNEETSRRSLAGRAALVTGGLSGLGSAIAYRLAQEGCDIVILSLGAPAVEGEVRHFQPTDADTHTTALIEEAGARVRVIDGDAASRADLERTLEISNEFAAIDIVVNNAGTNAFHPLVGHDEALWRRVIEVNLIAPFLTSQVFLPDMLSRGFGRIVSIASTQAHVGSAGYTAYCASKHGLLGLTRALALEVAGTGVTVNTVSPSFIDTAGAQLHVQKHADANGVSYEEMLDRVLAGLPQKRFIRPDEVAAAVAFLCNEASESINGTDLAVTGASAA